MKKLLMICATLLIGVGCKSVPTDIKPVLEVDKSEIVLNYAAQDFEVAVRTNKTLNVEVSARWVLYEVAESGDRVYFHALENIYSEPRTAEVVIMAGELSHTLTITQNTKPEVMQLQLGHTSTHLDSPEFGGENIAGSVEWGDGTTEEYSEGISHEYADSQRHNAQFTMEGATSFYIESIGDIESVVISF